MKAKLLVLIFILFRNWILRR